ncbi:MAG: hypothetical protein L3K06_00860, partial [Thermoplasmata archaeon]|nr:hypothetical protein [Thermoplasmata archaeon]
STKAGAEERERARHLGLDPERERALCEHLGLPPPVVVSPGPVEKRAVVPAKRTRATPRKLRAPARSANPRSPPARSRSRKTK